MIYLAEKTRLGAALQPVLQERAGEPVEWAPASFSYQPDDLIVAAVDNCRLDRLEYWEEVAREKKIGFFPVQVHGGEVIIGPEIRDGRPGCLRCWMTRYFGGRKSARRFAEKAAVSDIEPASDPWLTPAAVSIVVQLASELVLRTRGRISSSALQVYYFDLRTLTGRDWPLTPDPCCPKCAQIPPGTAEKALVQLTSRPKPYPQADRLRAVRELSYVHDVYVGRRTNVISDVSISWPLRRGAVVTVAVPLAEGRQAEPCSGFCTRYSDARTVAILEGLERYSGARPRAWCPSVHGSVSSLPELAIDPRCFGLHSDREYKANPDLLTPYSEQLEIDFVWAFSLKQRRPVVVPRQLGFYSLGMRHEPLFVIEGSIGCALGTCVEECILHGIFEVIERDSFLLTWYAGLKPPRLDPMECRDPEVRHYIRHLQAEGFDVFAFDITTDFGIPSVWVMARRRDHNMPHAVCLGAAHLRPEEALKKGFRELSGVVARYAMEVADEKMRRRAQGLVEDPSSVRTMMDHALFYCVPESGAHLEFLMENEICTSLEAMNNRCRELWAPDLENELRAMIERIIASGSDVIVVNQTAPEQISGGFCTYKTLIPGAIPMTWGEHLRRIESLPRLEAALAKRTREEGVPAYPNPAPHPYP